MKFRIETAICWRCLCCCDDIVYIQFLATARHSSSAVSCFCFAARFCSSSPHNFLPKQFASIFLPIQLICRFFSSLAWSFTVLLSLFFPTEISDIPDEIKYLQSLHTVYINSNPINSLPLGFSQLKNLTILGLNDLSLESLPDDFGK